MGKAKRELSGWRLQQVRRRTAMLNPLCVECDAAGITRIGEELDHVVPLHKGGSDEPSNLQWLCKEHHRRKTAEDCGHTYRPPIGLDGWPQEVLPSGGAVEKSKLAIAQNRPLTSFLTQTAKP